MRRLMCPTLALSIALMLSSAAWAQSPVRAAGAPVAPAPPSGTISLFQSDRRLLVMMQVGEGELVPMVFDTGSDGHSFDRMIVLRNRLKHVGSTTEIDGTTGTRRQLPRYAIERATLGGLPVGRIEGVGLDYDRSDAMGIITPDMFGGNLVLLELAKSRARVVPMNATSTPAGAPTAYQGNLPAVRVMMPDGTVELANLDTGYDAPLSLPVAMMGKVPLMTPAKVVGRFKSIDSEGDVYGGRVRGQVRIGPVVLDNPFVTFLGTVMNVGLPVIRRMTLVLDPAGKRDWTLPLGDELPPRG